jgi:hypothetical protein
MARILDDAPLLASPQRHDTRRDTQSPLPPHSPQRKGAESSPLLWVRVTRSGELAPSERGADEGSYWWPACVCKLKNTYLRPNADLLTGY